MESDFFGLTPFAISCLLTAVFSLALGTFVYLKKKKALLNQLWAAVSLAASAWSLGFLGVVNASNGNIAFRWQCLLDIAAIFIPIFFFHFTLAFLNSRRKRRRRYKNQIIAVYFLGIVLSILSFSSLFKKEMAPIFDFKFWITPGKLYLLFPLFFLGVIVYSFYLLIRGRHKLTGVKRTQIKYILIAMTIGFGGGMTNFLPQLIKIYPIGNYFVVFSLIAVGYTITHYRLLNLKIVTTEILVTLISAALLADIFLATSLFIAFFKSAIFLAFLYLGILLIRSVQNEIKKGEQLKIANIKLKALGQAKTEFLAVASHQLRTPLTAIRGYLSMLRRGDYGRLPTRFVDPLREVYQSTLRLTGLTNRLLDATRIETGQLKMNLGPVSLAGLISSVVDELKPQAKGKNLYLKFLKPKEKLPSLPLDLEKIRQVLLNVIDNGLKYTQKGGIEISLGLVGVDRVRIKVRDTGEGMTKEELKKIFQSFSRGLAGKKFHAAGAGLGLYIAKEFVALHQGKIWATSPGKGKGTTIWIEFPLKSHQAKTEKDVRPFSGGKGKKIP